MECDADKQDGKRQRGEHGDRHGHDGGQVAERLGEGGEQQDDGHARILDARLDGDGGRPMWWLA